MKNNRSLLGILCLVYLLQAYQGDAHSCTLIAYSGIALSVYDQGTGEAIQCDIYIELVRDDGLQEILSETGEENCSSSEAFNGLYGAAGNYQLTINKEGYDDFFQDDINIGLTSDGCHVVTEEVVVFLTPTEQ